MNTSIFQVGKEQHCSYCGQRVEPHLIEDAGPGLRFAEYRCDCELATKESELNHTIDVVVQAKRLLQQQALGFNQMRLMQLSSEHDRIEAEMKEVREAMQEGNA